MKWIIVENTKTQSEQDNSSAKGFGIGNDLAKLGAD